LAELLELAGGDQAFVTEMIDSYLATSPALLEQIRTSIAKQDAGALRLAAHTLKSGSRDMGVTALAQLFARLESMGTDGKLEGAADLFAQADALYAHAAAELSSARVPS
jgi:HPt (histidine-containing phosphotransfer) domain-containing protein